MQEFQSQKIKAVLKELLKKRGFTHQSLSESLECSVATVKRILGPEELSLSRLLQLCSLLEIDLADLQSLLKETDPAKERFTKEQENFLVKNRAYLSYLLSLSSGESPKQIAEKHGLTPRSTDKYLIGLERMELIRVTGRQKVKPAFKSFPTLGDGPLAKTYFEIFIRTASDFFTQTIKQAIGTSHLPKEERITGKFAVNSLKITRASYEKWQTERERANQDLTRLASFEEKTKSSDELMTMVLLDAHTLLKSEDPLLKIVEGAGLGPIPNL